MSEEEQMIEDINNNCLDYDEEMKRLENQLQQKESIIKEVREYITFWHYRNDFRINSFTTDVKKELLEILDKENK